MKQLLFLLLAIIIFSGCSKNDNPVTPSTGNEYSLAFTGKMNNDTMFFKNIGGTMYDLLIGNIDLSNCDLIKIKFKNKSSYNSLSNNNIVGHGQIYDTLNLSFYSQFSFDYFDFGDKGFFRDTIFYYSEKSFRVEHKNSGRFRFIISCNDLGNQNDYFLIDSIWAFKK